MLYMVKMLLFFFILTVSAFSAKVAVGDNVYVESWPIQKYSSYAVVKRDSSIILPFYKKEIKIAGLELSKASFVVDSALEIYFKDINFSLKFAGVTTIKVSIVGAVSDPGEYLFPSGSRLSSIIKKLDLNRIKNSRLNTISASNDAYEEKYIDGSAQSDNENYFKVMNSFKFKSNKKFVFSNRNNPKYPSNVSFRNISVIRGDSLMKFDLRKFFYDGNMLNNPEIYDGDIIKMTYKSNSIYLKGAFNSPGRYEIKNNETLKDLVEMSGGLLPSADSNRVYIYNSQKQKQYIVKYLDADSIRLNNFDNIYVEFYSDLVVAPEVTITGAINKPGLYPIDSSTTLRSFIDKAGGLNKNAFLLGTKIHRDIGPIQGPFSSSWKKDYINLSLMKKDTISLDIKLLDGDRIYVPVATNSVYVMGYVGKPGSFAYISGKSAKYYLGLAGGKNSFAYNSMIRVIKNKNGKILPISKVKNIENGDVIYVPAYVPFVASPGWRIFKDVIFVLSAAVSIMSSNVFSKYVIGQ